MPCKRTLAIARTTLFNARAEIDFDDLFSLIIPRKFLPSEAKNLRQYFVFSVLPDPDSPLITIDWLREF